MVELKKICFPLEKNEFWAHCEFRIFGLKKDTEYLYPLFDIFSKQTTCELKTSTSKFTLNNDFKMNRGLNLCKV